MFARPCVLIVVLVSCGDDGSTTTEFMDARPIDAALGDGSQGDGSMSTSDAAIAAGPACGTTTCMLGTQDCCLGTNFVCKAAGTCPSQGFGCDGPEDCTAGICCFGNQGGGGSECKTSNCNAVACHVDNDCPIATPKCCPKPFTPNYNVCQASCT